MLVAAGTYSPSTNSEVFPIEMASGIHLIGSGEDVSIIDAQQTSRVITMEECDNNIISDLTITGGLADSYGGGMNLHTSDPILTNVTISNNTANWGGGMHLSNSNPTLTHVTISNNQALQGGGMRLVSSDPILTNVTISNNTASESGGMRLFNSNPILTHVTISNNTAEYYGGGMRLSNSDPILTNVTIANNTANNGGGGMYLNYSDPNLTNSIIWDNSPQSIYTSSGTPLITYSDIEGGWEGEGNIDADPLFCDAENEDFTLAENSPCVGTGQDGANMGAYGVGCEPDDVCSACNIYYTDGYPGFCCDMAWDEGGLTCLYVETEWGLDCGGCNCFGDFAFCEEQGLVMCSDYSCAESLSQCPPECNLGDVNCDGTLNVLDIVLAANMVLADEYDEIADINEDGELNILDLVILVNLVLFGNDVIIEGCMDDGYQQWSPYPGVSACNYNPDAIVDDGSCEYAEENYDCDGNCMIEIDCSGICGSNLTDQNGDGLCDEWIELTVIDVDGNIYNTIQIGYQLWMAENLKVTHYRDGTPIITGLSEGEWYDLDEIEAGAYVVYDDDPSNTDIYGNLYNWYVVDDDRGVCPEDFHVPSDEEWMELEVFLGMREEETTDGAGRGTDEGAKLAGNSTLWNNGVTTNSPEFGSSGFSALPGGKKHQLGSCYQMGSEANFWSSSKPYNSALTAWQRGVDSDVTTVYRMTWGVRWGFSIRCLKD